VEPTLARCATLKPALSELCRSSPCTCRLTALFSTLFIFSYIMHPDVISGIMPNPAMPNTFVAQGYDMDDPTGSLGCYHSGCCGNLTKDKDDPACAGCVGICNGWSAGIPINREPSCGSAADCPGPRKCPQPSTGAPTYMPDGCAPVYMGPIHDRNKKPIGARKLHCVVWTAQLSCHICPCRN
jgi:hypothetical protein